MKSTNLRNLFLTIVLLLSNTYLMAQDSDLEIPPDLGKSAFTLLAVSPEKNAPAKWLEDALEKHYKGQYEIIEQSELYSKKYADRAKYPYALLVFDGYTPGEFSAGGRTPPNKYYYYGIREMKTNKLFRWDSGKVNYKTMINDYVKAIEKLRKTNSGE